jgi:hypothetical protein
MPTPAPLRGFARAIASLAVVSAIVVPGCDNAVLRPNRPATRLTFTVQPANVSANHGVLGRGEVARSPDHHAEHLRRQVAQQAFDHFMSSREPMTSRTSIHR